MARGLSCLLLPGFVRFLEQLLCSYVHEIVSDAISVRDATNETKVRHTKLTSKAIKIGIKTANKIFALRYPGSGLWDSASMKDVSVLTASQEEDRARKKVEKGKTNTTEAEAEGEGAAEAEVGASRFAFARWFWEGRRMRRGGEGGELEKCANDMKRTDIFVRGSAEPGDGRLTFRQKMHILLSCGMAAEDISSLEDDAITFQYLKEKGAKAKNINPTGVTPLDLKNRGAESASDLLDLGFDSLHLADPSFLSSMLSAYGSENVLSAFLRTPIDAVALASARAMTLLGSVATLAACAGAPGGPPSSILPRHKALGE